MIDTRTTPYAALLLRVTLGAFFLAHAGLKLFVFTPAGTAKFFGSLGLPPALAYVTMTLEVIGAVALILGVWTRVAAIALTPILLGAIFTVHGANGFFFNNPTAVGNIRRSGPSHCWFRRCSAMAPMRCAHRAVRMRWAIWSATRHAEYHRTPVDPASTSWNRS